MNKFKEIESIKVLFEKILGSEIIVVDEDITKDVYVTKENIFINFVKKLEEAFETENKIYEAGRIELGPVTEPLWLVLEDVFKLLYGEDIRDLIWWYIFFRIGEDGKVIPFIDDDKEYIFKNAQELWTYVKTNYK
jgi:hypothetical protein